MVGRSKRLRLCRYRVLDHCPHSVLYVNSHPSVATRGTDKLTQLKMCGTPTTFLYPLPGHTTAGGTYTTRIVSSRTGNLISRLVGPIARSSECLDNKLLSDKLYSPLYISWVPIIDLLHLGAQWSV